jgi:hypothetical protein
MSKKEWIGKLRIYLLRGDVYYSFCWISMEKNGSLLFGFSSKNMRFTEYGSCVVRSGFFTNHSQTKTKGNLSIKKADKPHITFHPPTIVQKVGITHMVDGKGKVDEWNLDWFPVKRPQALLFAYSGDISKLDEVTKLKGNRQVIRVTKNVNCLRMELILHPIPKSNVIIGRPDTLTNILGFCPNYIVCCEFDPVNIVDPAVYIATDEYQLQLHA